MKRPRSFRRLTLAAVALTGIASSATAVASSLTDYFGPRELSLGEALRADAEGGLATTMNPAGLALNRQLVFDGSYGYRPGDSASTVGVSACDSTVPVAGCFYYHYFSADPTVEGMDYNRHAHEFGIAAARAVTSRFSIGVNTRYFDYTSNLAGETSSSGFAADVGANLRASESIQIAVVGYNVLAADSDQYPMGVGGGLSLRPIQPLSIGLDGLWNLDVEDGESTGRYGTGLEYFIQSGDRLSGYPLRAGALYDHQLEATYVTAGLGLTTMKVGIDVGARKQVDGGDELMIQAGLRLFGPHLP